MYRQLRPRNVHGKDAHADGLNDDDKDNNNGNEQVDALAKGPRRDVKGGGGKGAPAGGGGKGYGDPVAGGGKGKGDDPEVKAGRQCNCCRGWGHYGRACLIREKIYLQSGNSFGSEYGARSTAKGAPKGGRCSGKGVNGVDGEDGYEGQEDARALDEDVVFADTALDGWHCANEDFCALALNTRGAALSCPKFVSDSFCECSDSNAEVDESEDNDVEVDGLEDNDDDDDDDLTDLIKSLSDDKVARDVRDSARESYDNPWHGDMATPGGHRDRRALAKRSRLTSSVVSSDTFD